MTDAEAFAYLLKRWNDANKAARDDYRHHGNRQCPQNHRCPYRLARTTT